MVVYGMRWILNFSNLKYEEKILKDFLIIHTRLILSRFFFNQIIKLRPPTHAHSYIYINVKQRAFSKNQADFCKGRNRLFSKERGRGWCAFVRVGSFSWTSESLSRSLLPITTQSLSYIYIMRAQMFLCVYRWKDRCEAR